MTPPTINISVSTDEPIYSQSQVLEIIAAALTAVRSALPEHDQRVADATAKAILDYVNLAQRDQSVADAVMAATRSSLKLELDVTSMPDRVMTRRVTERTPVGLPGSNPPGSLLEEVVALETDA